MVWCHGMLRGLFLLATLLLLEPSRGFAEDLQSNPWANSKMVTGREAPGYVAFTFDDGPNLDSTPLILDALEAYQVPATFFVVGRHFARNTDDARAGALLLQEIEQRGFTIGNHTANHQHLPSLSLEAATHAVSKNAGDLEALLGHKVHLFRPPFGATTSSIRRMVRRRGDTMVRWNIDPKDARRSQPKNVTDRVLRDILAKNGGVVLLHDTKPWTAQALPGLLAALEQANCDRLAAGNPPILPVSLHYFLRDSAGARPIPEDVMNTTQSTMEHLYVRCEQED